MQEFQEETFESDVIESELPVLVDFWAPWCAPCRMIMPSVEALAEEYAGQVKIGKLNIDENPGIAQKYSVRSIPTLIVFKDGQPVDQAIGGLPKDKIEELIKSAL